MNAQAYVQLQKKIIVVGVSLFINFPDFQLLNNPYLSCRFFGSLSASFSFLRLAKNFPLICSQTELSTITVSSNVHEMSEVQLELVSPIFPERFSYTKDIKLNN